jgi:hypothetical protein
VNTTTFDRLTYVDKLKEAGIDERSARAHADALEQALREEVATKADITALKTDVLRLEHKLEVGLRDVTIRLGSLVIAGVVVLAGIKFFG